ncbi:MAG: hypothetical protein NC421_11360 [Lachnospiraceae bacterium]|nr:hypothetical protein [Lachnospiraceae bacterium]
MLKRVSHNPYRVLGVYSNSSKKDVLSNLNKIRAYLKVGKEISFPLDLPQYFPPLERTDDKVADAQSAVELPIDQLKHTVFWFMKATPFDDIAFNHLFNGNIDKAKEIWCKKKSVSSLLNLMVCAIIEHNNIALALNADTLFQDYSSELCSTVNDTIKLSSEQLTELFVDLLKDDSSIKFIKLAKVPGTSSCWQKAFGASMVKPLIDEITTAINEAKNVKGAAANYAAGIKLMNSTKSPLLQLMSWLGSSDVQYQIIADKLAQTILQCGINYFNESDDNNAPQKALTLQSYALSIAIGQLVKDRCRENIKVLQKIGPEYEVRKEISEISHQLKCFNIWHGHSFTAIESFIKACNPHLQSIKLKLGGYSEIYLRMSSSVAFAAINDVVLKINNLQTTAVLSSDKSSLKLNVSSAVSLMSRISELDMTTQCRTYFNNNNSILNSLNSRLNPSGGCYIATMAYGDYNHPQVMVLRDFRDSFLAKRDWGQHFIKYYYAHSPNWVEKLKHHKTINAVIRKVLDAFALLWKNISHYE